jgi:hypothetical protein
MGPHGQVRRSPAVGVNDPGVEAVAGQWRIPQPRRRMGGSFLAGAYPSPPRPARATRTGRATDEQPEPVSRVRRWRLVIAPLLGRYRKCSFPRCQASVSFCSVSVALQKGVASAKHGQAVRSLRMRPAGSPSLIQVVHGLAEGQGAGCPGALLGLLLNALELASTAVFVRPDTLRARRLPLILPRPITPRQRPEHVRWNRMSRQCPCGARK